MEEGTLSTGPTIQSFVHKSSSAEVFVGEAVPLPTTGQLNTDTVYRVPIFPPVRDGVYTQDGRSLTLSFLAEAMRQAAYVACHRRLGVTLGSHFVMDRLRVQAASSARLDPAAGVSVDVRYPGSARWAKVGRTVPRALVSRFVFRSGNSVLAWGQGDMRILKREVYLRLREGQVTSDQLPVTYTADPDPLITRVHGQWTLRAPIGHPVYFDHVLDHLPGLLVLDAAQQAARQRIGASAPIRWVDGRFHAFLELDRLVQMFSYVSSAASGYVEIFKLFQGRQHCATVTVGGGEASSLAR